MSYITKTVSYILILYIMNTVSVASAKLPESSDKIVITLNNWNSQIVMSHVLSKLLQKLNYNTDFYKIDDTITQFGILARGKSHIQIEVWEGTMADAFNEYLKKELIVDAGSHDAKTREEWWYPEYVEELCPGLPNWEYLNACYRIFAKLGDDHGQYLAGPWEKPDIARIRALNLKFNVKKVQQERELWDELTAAYNQKKPIILFNWTPNWVESKYKGKFIEFPPYSPDCESDPTWGINTNFTFDCGNPKDGWLKKAAWAKVSNKWPCAYNVLLKANFTNKMIADAAYFVEIEKLSNEEAADKWLKTYKEIWHQWLDSPECKA